MTTRHNGATGTYRSITMRFVLLAIKLFAIRSDLSRQRLLAHRRIETASMSLCITIRFVLLAIIFLQCDLICLDSDSDRLNTLRYDLSRQLPNLSVKWVNFYVVVMTHSVRHRNWHSRVSVGKQIEI